MKLNVLILISLLLLFVGCQQIPTEPTVVATVNGESITQEDIDVDYDRLPEITRAGTTKEDVLNQLIERKVLLQEAKRLGIVVDESLVEEQYQLITSQFSSQEELDSAMAQQNFTVAQLRARLSEQVLITKLLEAAVIANIQATEDELVSFYKENIDQFKAKANQRRAAHILVETEEEAQEIYDLLQEPDADFNLLATERSIDPSAQVNGGELGIFTREAMVTEFGDAVWELDVNEISEPVQTQFGYHIIKRLAGSISFNEAREVIELNVKNQKQEQEIRKFADALISNANVVRASEDSSDLVKANDLILTEDELCEEDGKPIIRRYTSSTCTKCDETASAFRKAIADYDVAVIELELDTGDDLTTLDVESAMSPEEFEILKKYNPNGAIPSFVFGCKYLRAGNAYEGVHLEAEEKAFREILDEIV